MNKKSLLIIMCIVVFCVFFSVSAFAEERGTGSNIELSYNEILLYPDDYDVKLTLQGDYNPSNIKKIEAYTDDANVATVNWKSISNYGTVYGDNIGNTQLTVKVYEEYTESYDWVTTLKCNVYVGKKPSFQLKNYVMSPDEKSQEFLFNNYPDGMDCVLSSSDDSVATVNQDGFVTPRHEGTCKIYAKFGQKTISTNMTILWMPNYKTKITKIDKKKGVIKVNYKNVGKKSIKIINKNATFWFKNEKQSRKLKGKTVTIEPGMSKSVSYFVKGKKIKGSMKGAYIYYQVSCAGEKVDAWVDKTHGSYEYLKTEWWSDYDVRY